MAEIIAEEELAFQETGYANFLESKSAEEALEKELAAAEDQLQFIRARQQQEQMIKDRQAQLALERGAGCF